MQIFEGIPIAVRMCMYCTSQGIDPQVATMEVLLMFNGPPKVVEVCDRCYHSLKGLGAVASLGRSATREEMRAYYVHNGFQVSGDDSAPQKGPQEALAQAIEPQAAHKSQTLQKALEVAQERPPEEGLWKEDASPSPPTRQEPLERRWQCVLCGPDSMWMSDENRNHHRARVHPEFPIVAVMEWLPKHKFPCQKFEHLEWGCKVTKPTADEIHRHETGRGPSRAVTVALKAARQGGALRTTTASP